MDRLISPTDRDSFSQAIVKLTQSTPSQPRCLVLGGTTPALSTLITDFTNHLRTRGVSIAFVIDQHHAGQPLPWTPSDVVHAQRDQSCVILTDRADEYRVVRAGIPTINVFETLPDADVTWDELTRTH